MYRWSPYTTTSNDGSTRAFNNNLEKGEIEIVKSREEVSILIGWLLADDYFRRPEDVCAGVRVCGYVTLLLAGN